jgi:hypothetical protein
VNDGSTAHRCLATNEIGRVATIGSWECIVDGLETFPETVLLLCAGTKPGKLMLTVGG